MNNLLAALAFTGVALCSHAAGAGHDDEEDDMKHDTM